MPNPDVTSQPPPDGAALAEAALVADLSGPGPSIDSPRRYDLDWLRVLAMAGIFLFHNARFFDPLDWHVKNAEHSTLAFVFVAFMDRWQMPLFVLLAGAGTWFALERRTAGEYLRERVQRLLVPLYTVGLFLLIPPQYYWDQVTKGRYRGSFLEFYPRFVTSIELRPGWGFLSFWSGHLWFLRSLFVYSLICLPVCIFFKSTAGRALIARLAAWCSAPGGVLLAALPVAAVQIGLRPLWSAGEHGGVEDVYLLTFFIVGYLSVADARFTETLRRRAFTCLGLAGGTFLWMAWLVLARGYTGWQRPDYAPLNLAFFATASLNTWCFLAGFLGLAARHLNRPSPLLGHLNEAVLPFYVLHQTVILAVGRWVVAWPLNMAAKYVVISMLSFLLIIGLYAFVTRRVRVLRFLFGMRGPPFARIGRS